MTDPRSHRPDGPSEDGVEARLRRTLTTVADREPVPPQLDDLRERIAAEPAGGSTDGAPDARSTRRWAVGAVIAAAVLAVVVAGALVATRDGDEVTASAPDPLTGTGWYLPGPGSGWALVDVTGVPWAPMGSVLREVGFQDIGPPSRRIHLSEHRRTSEDDPVASLEPVDRGRGASSRTYGVISEDDGQLRVVMATRGDRVLSAQADDVDAETVYRVVDDWWESDGERIEPIPGMVRTSDLSASGDRGRSGHTQVIVTVRRKEDGLQLSYALTPSGATLLPTGVDADDRGASGGLDEDERPRPLRDLPDAPGSAWEVGPDSSPGATSVLSLAPGADIQIADDLGFAPPPTGAAPGGEPDPTQQVVRRRAHIELLGALRSTSADAWADAVADVGADPDLAASTLADVPTSDIGPGTTTTVPAATDDPPPTSSTTTTPTTSTSRFTAQGIDPQAWSLSQALIAFARDPSDETFERIGLSRTIVRRGLHGDSGIGGPMDAERLRDPAEWDLGEPYGSPLTLIAGTDVAVTTFASATFCGEPLPTVLGTHLAVIVPVDPPSCTEDFAIVLSGSGSSLTDVLTIVP